MAISWRVRLRLTTRLAPNHTSIRWEIAVRFSELEYPFTRAVLTHLDWDTYTEKDWR